MFHFQMAFHVHRKWSNVSKLFSSRGTLGKLCQYLAAPLTVTHGTLACRRGTPVENRLSGDSELLFWSLIATSEFCDTFVKLDIKSVAK